MINDEEEYILCAAIWYKEFPKAVNSVLGIDRGVVVPAFRHPHSIGIVHSLTGKRTVTMADDGVGEYDSNGFLTSRNRWVDRKEAKTIFERTTGRKGKWDVLYSEDLY